MAKKNNSNLRDKKGRVLRTGERQKADGRYEFRYQDSNGITKSIYSWKLVGTDTVPKGKKNGISLREMEKKISQDIYNGLNTGSMSARTLNEWFDEYLEGKKRLKDSTRANYKFTYDRYVREYIGSKMLTSIDERQIKKFYVHLLEDLHLKPASMEIVHTLLHPTFTRAVRAKVILVNPTEGAMAELREDYSWERTHRVALSEQEQEYFVDFVSKSRQFRHWMPLFTVMLGTGCRIGEIIGLRWSDVNFDEGYISINHQVIYRQGEGGGNCRFRYSSPKTSKGNRIIPMLDDVKEALIKEKARQDMTGDVNTMVVDGHDGFIFSNRYQECLSPHCINRALERIVNAYNDEEAKTSKEENREPHLLPHITCHIFRHTFATRMFENDAAVKVIQVILGHSEYNTTMDIYADLLEKKKRIDMDALNGKFRIS